jgi:predicted DNA-binding transcriptional regulator YafY
VLIHKKRGTGMQISRLFEIVYILMNKKVTTARELSEHFEVSQRTIYRDIETLCQAGIPLFTSKGKGGGIGLMEHFVLNKSVLSEKEQRDILNALQGLKATSYEDVNQVLSKLNSLFGNKNPDWIEVDFSYWNSSERDKSIFMKLKEAIINHKVIEFDYFSTKGEESHRITEPVKLIFKVQAWYLNGYCRERKAYRYFKISRINNLKVWDESFIPITLGIAVNDNSSYHNNPTIELILRIESRMAFRVYDEFPKSAITRAEDGSFTIRYNTNSGNWLTGYLMTYEDCIEVLEPSWLREKLIDKYKKALLKNKYDV